MNTKIVPHPDAATMALPDGSVVYAHYTHPPMVLTPRGDMKYIEPSCDTYLYTVEPGGRLTQRRKDGT